MDERKKLWDALDLVDDDRVPAGVGRDELVQPFRSRVVVALGFRIEEIDPRCIRMLSPQPRGLAGAARPEQEVAAGRMVEEFLNTTMPHLHLQLQTHADIWDPGHVRA